MASSVGSEAYASCFLEQRCRLSEVLAFEFYSQNELANLFVLHLTGQEIVFEAVLYTAACHAPDLPLLVSILETAAHMQPPKK